MLDVLCLGEALWDLEAPSGRTFAEARSLHLRPGGAAVNVALRLARKGLSVGLATVVGADALGDALAERLEARGVSIAAIERAPQRTGLVLVERTAEGRRVVAYRNADEPAPKVAPGWQARALLLTGLLPSEEQAASFAAASREAHAQGAVVVVDVNARPRMWRGRGTGAALAAIGEADVVKVSEEDLAVLRQDAATLRARMREGAVLVRTAGPGPATAVGSFGEVARGPKETLAGDALAAGDAFVAGLLVAMVREGGTRDRAFWGRALRKGHALARAFIRRTRRKPG